jgi:hypothetical protein
MPSTMSATSSVFATTFIGLLGAPIASPGLAWGITKLPTQTHRWVYLALAAWPAAIWALSALGVSSASPDANAIAVVAALWATVALALSAYRLRSQWLRHLLGAVGLLLLAFCVFMGTLGGLATAFVVGDTVPVFSQRTPSGRACSVTSYGNATTAFGGYVVAISEPLVLAPFLEQVVKRKPYEKPKEKPAELCQANL